MQENQHIEYKLNWRDEYLKTLCGFANAEGGELLIGVDDNGVSTGIIDSRKLLEALPNKILQKLGIHALVHQIEKDGENILSIIVDRYDVPISFNGKYYIRTGSTTQELKDKELTRFLLKKSKMSWEGITEDKANLDDISEDTLAKFKKLAKKRVPGIENEDTHSVLKKLHLIDTEGHLKRAAILLFGNDPLKYYHSAYFKIGKFMSDTDLVTDDVIEGNLFDQLDLILEVLRVKYLRLMVKGYKDWKRIEEYEYPEDAMREAVINALIHKDYTGSHTQMKIYPDKIMLWNPGTLLEGITIKQLRASHQSVLRNELICNAFYKASLIESWGRGTVQITENCLEAGLPEPEFREAFGGFEVIFYQDKYTEKYLKDLGLNERQVKAVNHIKNIGKITNKTYQEINSVSNKTAYMELAEIVDLQILKVQGKGRSISYTLKL
ncbi:MAG: ATP-binding protein [Chitinophagales bacterium]